MSEHTIPGGRDKGGLLTDASDNDLTWWLNKKKGDVAKDPQGRHAASDRAWIAAAEHEVARRQGEVARRQGEGEPPHDDAQEHKVVDVPNGKAPQQTKALQKASAQALGRAMYEAEAVTAKMLELASAYHMVSPATHVDDLPIGCGVALSYVSVDPNDGKDGPGDVCDVGSGKVGLSAVVLSKIAAAAGVSWDAERSGRLDNGSHPHYVHYRAVGHVRNFDGSTRTLTGEVEIDAREDSPQIEEIRQKAAGRDRSDGGARQILELRKFLLRHAERKAKSRAIADLGIKRSYTRAELKKPFAVARLMFTGQTDDPVQKQVFALKTADRMLASMSALCGPPPARPAQLKPAPPPLETAGEPLNESLLGDAG